MSHSTQRAHKNYRRTGLTEDQAQEATEAFELFDPHGTQNITYH
jgi:Ca2+-binding EF-hand superfamily protein